MVVQGPVVAWLFAGLLVFGMAPYSQSVDAQPVLVHGPVEFHTNFDLGNSALCVPNGANGVVGGCGQPNDPWIVEGWIFGYECLVLVRHCFVVWMGQTTEHVVFRDNLFVHARADHDLVDEVVNTVAIGLHGTQNVRIEDNEFRDNALALIAHGSAGIAAPSENVDFRGNQVLAMELGVSAFRVSGGFHRDFVIEDNVFVGQDEAAVQLDSVSEVEITGNVITDNMVAIDCFSCSSALIEHNTIRDNDVGLDFTGSSCSILDNEFTDNRIGYDNFDSWCAVHGNNFQGNTDFAVTHIQFGGPDQDFTDNYWGSPLGPGPCGGCGDHVSGLEADEYTPFLILPNDDAGA